MPRMDEELYANVTTNEYSGLLPGVNLSSKHIFDEHEDQGSLCANYTKTPPVSYYINSSQEIYPGDWIDMDYEHTTKLCALILIIVTGLVGNISVILTIALNRSMRTTLNFYIANLAVADTMTYILTTFYFYIDFSSDFSLGEFLCKTQIFALRTCFVCSTLTLAAISCDRFMAVFFPLHVRVTTQRKPLVATLIWILSIAVSIPYLHLQKIQVTEWKNFQQKRCLVDW